MMEREDLQRETVAQAKSPFPKMMMLDMSDGAWSRLPYCTLPLKLLRSRSIPYHPERT
jgi:hypothetical protein